MAKCNRIRICFHKILTSSSYSHRIPKKKKENHIHRAFSQKCPLKTKSTVDHLVGETRPATSFSHLRQHQNPTTTSPILALLQIRFFPPQDRGIRLYTKSPRVTTTSRSDQLPTYPERSESSKHPRNQPPNDT